jgi:hypothetical protein
MSHTGHLYKCKSYPCDTCYDSGVGSVTQLQELPGGNWRVLFPDAPADTIMGGQLNCYKYDKANKKLPS